MASVMEREGGRRCAFQGKQSSGVGQLETARPRVHLCLFSSLTHSQRQRKGDKNNSGSKTAQDIRALGQHPCEAAALAKRIQTDPHPHKIGSKNNNKKDGKGFCLINK